MLRKVLKDGEMKFYEGDRAANKKKAQRLVSQLKKEGYKNFKVYYNSFGYIVKE